MRVTHCSAVQGGSFIMTNNSRSSTQTRLPDGGPGRVAAIGRFVVLALVLATAKLTAQEVSVGSRGAIRPFVGAYLPTGDQRDFVKDAVVLGAQASWTLNSNFALAGTFGWAPSKDKVTAGDRTLDQFQYD